LFFFSHLEYMELHSSQVVGGFHGVTGTGDTDPLPEHIFLQFFLFFFAHLESMELQSSQVVGGLHGVTGSVGFGVEQEFPFFFQPKEAHRLPCDPMQSGYAC
jgi:hypothetical protein